MSNSAARSIVYADSVRHHARATAKPRSRKSRPGPFGGALGRSRSKIIAELSSLEVEFWDQLAAHRRVIVAANGAPPARQDRRVAAPALSMTRPVELYMGAGRREHD